MPAPRRGRKGFTLIEALVAVVLAGIGVAGSIQGIAALTKAQAKSQEKEVMVRLAQAKFDELIAIGEATNIGGTFDDWGDPRYTWEAVVDTTGQESLSQLTVTIKSSADGRSVEQSISGLVYEAPISTGAAQ